MDNRTVSIENEIVIDSISGKFGTIQDKDNTWVKVRNNLRENTLVEVNQVHFRNQKIICHAFETKL
jgi:hypothetical protein